MKLFFIALLFIPIAGFAKIPQKEILSNFKTRLDQLHSKSEWLSFVLKNPHLFPKKTDESPHVVVKKETLKINGENFTIGIGYRQNFVPTDYNIVKDFMNTPKLFRFAYGLDGDSNVASNPITNPQTGSFKARIYKKIPGLEDQDYILMYNSKSYDDLYIIRAPLVKDKNNFALRDNLKVIQKVNGGTLIREINIIYPMRWYVRMMGPQMRSITKSEMAKVAKSENCLFKKAQKSGLSENLAQSCWLQSQ